MWIAKIAKTAEIESKTSSRMTRIGTHQGKVKA
jgi:hypothetical protein